ncbi:MAG: hypothetical protein ABSG56_19025 [Bryobacteraceae bacterium]
MNDVENQQSLFEHPVHNDVGKRLDQDFAGVFDASRAPWYSMVCKLWMAS